MNCTLLKNAAEDRYLPMFIFILNLITFLHLIIRKKIENFIFYHLLLGYKTHFENQNTKLLKIKNANKIFNLILGAFNEVS